MGRDNILTFAVLCVFHVWTLGVEATMVRGSLNLEHGTRRLLLEVIPLDMVPDSVDDMYNGCTEQMYNKVQKEYLEHEISKVGIFKQAWVKAERCAKYGKQRLQKHKSKLSVLTQGVKLRCTQCSTKQSGRVEQSTQPPSSSTPHFLLTDAIRLLKENQQGCHTTYWRTNMEFAGEVNQLIRFGFFASSSLDKRISQSFGEKSCFEIKTCAGAHLKSYPVLGEQEVLIPPVEMFKITKKEKVQNVLKCKSLFKLESVGFQNNLNCKAV
uniref:NAD(P)(+)--arginine ADP-ribosyltransferase n=1 Tax=Oncorhynchus kisutch TaxID=8019 RepID=A0A8C7H520_ONCKI